MSRRRRIRVENIGDSATVSFCDKMLVDTATSRDLGEELCSLVDEDGVRKLLLNFEGVEFLSSAALNRLILVDKKLKQVGGRLQLCKLRPEILEVFTITRLNRVFDIRSETRGLPEDDDDLEAWGAWVPRPNPPDNLDGLVDPPKD